MVSKREFLKTSEVCKMYGINRYFLKKLNVERYKTSEVEKTTWFYRIEDVDNAIDKWNEDLLNSIIEKRERKEKQ